MLNKEELVEELKEKFIEALGSESTAASVFEDPEFIHKLEQILYWLVGKVIFETPVRREPPKYIPPGEPSKQWKWEKGVARL